MTQAVSPKLHALWYPGLSSTMLAAMLPNTANLGPLDATGEKICMGGYVSMLGDASGSKTVSSSGGSIAVLTRGVGWASAGTTVRFGLQDADPTTSTTTPDGTYDVYGDLVQGTDSVSSYTWTSAAMSSGSKSITHGDMVCVVLDMVTRNGSDYVYLFSASAGLSQITSTSRLYTTSWQTPQPVVPNVLITCDDGTLCTLAGAFVVSSPFGVESFSNSTNPDERGVLLYVPWTCKVDAMRFYATTEGNVNADYDARIYSDPLGTPSQLLSISVEGAYSSSTSDSSTRECLIPFAPIDLSPGWYGLVLKATGTAAVKMGKASVNSASYKDLFGACSKITRNNETGAFTETDTSTYMGFALSISSIDDGAGGGGGGNTYSRGRVVNG